MNCAFCGNELLSDRAIFHCSCGVYLHAHCWNKHVLQAHQPEFEVGVLDMNGIFEIRVAEEDDEATPTEQLSQPTE